MNTSPLIALALLGLSSPAWAFIGADDPVSTVERDGPERQAIEPLPELLPEGVQGIFPERDGGHFVLMTRGAGLSVEDREGVLRLLEDLLPATGWTGKVSESLSVRPDTLDLTAPDAAWFEGEHSSLRSERLAQLEAELGELTAATLASVDELAGHQSRYAAEDRQLYRVDQLVDGVVAEGMGVSVVVHDAEVLSIHGALYEDDAIANFSEWKLDNAWSQVLEYVAGEVEVPELLSGAEVVVAHGKELRLAWRIIALLDDGEHGVLVDSGTGELLELQPRFYPVDATGLVADPTPDDGFITQSFEVDPAVDGSYTLTLTGVAAVSNGGADGVVSGRLRLPDDGSGDADFDVAPFNGTVIADATVSGYNGWFGDVNMFGWAVYEYELYGLWGALPLPALTIVTNDDWVCGYGVNNACASGATLTFGIGGLTMGNSSGLVNTALDSPVLSHELGHFVNGEHFDAGGGVLGKSINEGLADHWSHMLHDSDLIGYYTIQTTVDVEDGTVPRKADADDVFPEHMWALNESHANGQVMAWALWDTLRGMEDHTFLGKLVMNIQLLDAMVVAGVGASSTSDNLAVHDAYWALMAELVAQNDGRQDAHNVLAGFARAGIMASEKEAVIDIDDDYLSGTAAAGPRFTVFTGRDFSWAVNWAVADDPYLDRYEIEVANDPTFNTNYFSSGPRTDVAVSAEGVPMATWQLPSADWEVLRAGERLYYRLTAWSEEPSTGARIDERTSEEAFEGSVELPLQFAVINSSGTLEEETCGSCGVAPERGRPLWAALIGLGVLLGWRRRAP